MQARNKNNMMTKETAIEILNNTIKEMKQTLKSMDDDDVWCDTLSAEICLMNELYKNLCQHFSCKEYSTNIFAFISDLQKCTKLQGLDFDYRGGHFTLCNRRWAITPINNYLEITYSDNIGVDGVELKHDKLFSAEALIILDALTIEIFESFNEIMPLLREESKKRGQHVEEDDFKNIKHVYELTSLVMLNHNFPARECRRISHCTFSSLKKAENNIDHFNPDIYQFPDNYADCMGHFIEQIDIDCQWSRDIAKSYYPDQKMNACNIYPKDKIIGCKEYLIRYKKGDLVWCVDNIWRDKVRLGIVYDLPHSDSWYKRRLTELQEVFGFDYTFEMDEDSYLILFINENESDSNYPRGHCEWCATPFVFPVNIKEDIPEEIKSKLTKLLEYRDTSPWEVLKVINTIQ